MVSSVRYSRKIRLRRKTLIAILSIAALGADKPAPFKPKPAGDYESKSSFDKVTIAAEPYDTEEKTLQAFGSKIHPPQWGVLPVLVVIQNDRTTPLDARLLSFRYKVRGEHEIESTPAPEIRFAAGGPTPPKINSQTSTIPIPLPSRRKKNPLSDPVIDERAFAAKMIAPGESASGFVYFQTEYHGGATVTLSGLRDPASGQDLFFVEIPIVHR